MTDSGDAKEPSRDGRRHRVGAPPELTGAADGREGLTQGGQDPRLRPRQFGIAQGEHRATLAAEWEKRVAAMP